MVVVMDEEQLHDDHAVDEGPGHRVDEHAPVRRPEPEDEDAVERDRERVQDREPTRPAVHPVDVGAAEGNDALQLPEDAPAPAATGTGGKGGGIGPRLVGLDITVAQAKAQIDNGGGVMPAGLVSGTKEEDVLAYLATILRGS